MSNEQHDVCDEDELDNLGEVSHGIEVWLERIREMDAQVLANTEK